MMLGRASVITGRPAQGIRCNAWLTGTCLEREQVAPPASWRMRGARTQENLHPASCNSRGKERRQRARVISPFERRERESLSHLLIDQIEDERYHHRLVKPNHLISHLLIEGSGANLSFRGAVPTRSTHGTRAPPQAPKRQTEQAAHQAAAAAALVYDRQKTRGGQCRVLITTSSDTAYRNI